MWKLTSPSKDLINWYEKKMCTSLVSRIKASLDKRISKVLIPTLPTGGDDLSIVKRLLFEKPQKLYILNGANEYLASLKANSCQVINLVAPPKDFAPNINTQTEWQKLIKSYS